MTRCRIEGCLDEAVAKQLCARHYMRVRRTGDAATSAPLKPGPKPKPRDQAATDALVQAQERIEVLLRENAALRAAARQKPAPALQPEPRTDNEEIANLRRQLKAAQTRIRNLTAEKQSAWSAAKANPAAISKRDLNRLRMVLHPDRRGSVTEREMTEATQVINRLQLQIYVIDDG